MRRLLAALAVAGLVASGSGAVAQASGLDNARPATGAVLTPDQIGITQPAQGFSPFFVGAGGSNLGGIGLGGVAPTTLGTSAFFSGFGGCGVFSISFCPFFSSQPFTQTFLATNGGQLGLGAGLQGLTGLGGLGAGGLGTAGLGGISAQAFGPTGTGINGTVGSNGLGLGGLGFGGLGVGGLGFGGLGFGLGGVGVGGNVGGISAQAFGNTGVTGTVGINGLGFGGGVCASQGGFLPC